MARGRLMRRRDLFRKLGAVAAVVAVAPVAKAEGLYTAPILSKSADGAWVSTGTVLGDLSTDTLTVHATSTFTSTVTWIPALMVEGDAPWIRDIPSGRKA